jgi:hypothetical protein
MKNPEFPSNKENDKFTTFSINDYKGHAVVVSDNEDPHVYRSEVACNVGKVIYIHLDAYRILQKSPKFEHYLNIILEHEITHGVGHTHEELTHSDDEREILDLLKKEGYFE